MRRPSGDRSPRRGCGSAPSSTTRRTRSAWRSWSRSPGCSPRSWPRSRSRCGSTALWKIVRRASGHEQENGRPRADLRHQHGRGRHRLCHLVPRDPGTGLRHRAARLSGTMGLLDYYKQFDDISESEFNEMLRERRAQEKALALEQVPRAGPLAHGVARAAERRGGGGVGVPSARAAQRLSGRRRHQGASRRLPSATTSAPARSCSATARRS